MQNQQTGTETREKNTIRQVMAVFDEPGPLESAVEALESSGFDRAEISVLPPGDVVEEERGARYGSIAEAKADPDAPRVAPVTKVELVEGQAFAAGMCAFAGAVVGAAIAFATGQSMLMAVVFVVVGVVIGLVPGLALVKWIRDKRGRDLRRQKSLGGLVVWVRIFDPGTEAKAVEVLKAHQARSVEVRDMPAHG